MTWFEKYLAWRLRRAQTLIEKVNPIGALQVINTGQDDQQPWTTDTISHLQVYMVNVYAYAAMSCIGIDVASTPLRVQKKVFIDGIEQWETQLDGELFDLFNKINMSSETWRDLSERWVIGELSAGDSYMLYDPTENEFYYGRPDWIHVTADSMGRITGYKIGHSGLTVNMETPDLIHLKMVNPSGEYYGFPPSQVIKESIMTDINLDRYLNRFFKNNAMTGAVFQTDQKLDADTRKRIEKSVRQAYGGVDNAFKSVILEQGATLSRITASLSDLIPEEIDRRVMRKVLAAYRVPPIKIGSLDGASFANAVQQDRGYQQGAVEPRRVQIEMAITMQFIQPRFGPEWRVKYDRSDVAGLQEDKNELSKRIREEWKGGLLKFNEARESIGREPVEEDEGGNEFFVAPAAFMISPPPNDDDDKGRQPAIPLTGYEAKCNRFKLSKAAEQGQRDKHEGRLTKKEKKFAKIIADYFNAQVSRLIERLNEVTGNGKIMSHLHLYVSKDYDDDIAKNLFNLNAENDLLRREVGIAIAQVVESGGAEAVRDFGLPIDFDINAPGVQMTVENFVQKISIFNDHSKVKVQKLLLDGLNAGESIQEISKSLRTLYASWTDKTLDLNRSHRIARTEINGMVNAGASESYQQAGLGKEWLATLDGSTRPEHIVADGQRVGPKESFDVGGELLKYPGYPGGSAGNIINCRCSMIPVVIE